ncbi:MAG: hypothetical protein M5U19_21720 [Microthrixaceae bacterium]|nr:hypothetical protein [Microthrixaceae bacterium]
MAPVGDFGYTVGLANLGHPELHMWARPTDGTDPGADYVLSPRDICEILNIHAEMLLHGGLHVGDAFVRDLDAGMAEAHITVGAPVHPHEVEALGVQPGAKVLPLRWELVREPEGRSTPVSAPVAAQIERLAVEWRDLAEQLGADVSPGRPDTATPNATDRGPRRWMRPEVPSGSSESSVSSRGASTCSATAATRSAPRWP